MTDTKERGLQSRADSEEVQSEYRTSQRPSVGRNWVCLRNSHEDSVPRTEFKKELSSNKSWGKETQMVGLRSLPVMRALPHTLFLPRDLAGPGLAKHTIVKEKLEL